MNVTLNGVTYILRELRHEVTNVVLGAYLVGPKGEIKQLGDID